MHDRRIFGVLLVCCAALFTGWRALDAPTQQGLTITFIANEGVLLTSGNRKVLIDALFQKYGRGYATPADSTQRALEGARGVFDGVNLILATHHHGDHYHPVPVAAHMRANPRATLLTSQQVIDSLAGRVSAADPIRRRFLSRTTAPGQSRREVVEGISVELLGLPHGGHPGVEHLGFIVELGGRRVLHVGDTDFDESTFAPLRLDTARIDVALLPYGMVTNANTRRMVERWIKPKEIIGFHVSTGEGERVARAVREALPGATAFFRSLETRVVR